ncbi:hypothetical protein [Streptomyces sp. NRRL F-5650]|uniref:hypothetical protein n=1 Tax=Streptomyces sp. NRRL F-5650 TaxID=1463868 RepID=UPI00131E0B85|nr:hypothetical protein [Streptomyces sp. NRRL F-5650]
MSRPASSGTWRAGPAGVSRPAALLPLPDSRSVPATPGPATGGRPANRVAAGVWAWPVIGPAIPGGRSSSAATRPRQVPQPPRQVPQPVTRPLGALGGPRASDPVRLADVREYEHGVPSAGRRSAAPPTPVTGRHAVTGREG